MQFRDLNPDQRRELINTTQRFEAWREAVARQKDTRGSMVWATINGADYLLRSAWSKDGKRKQTSLGRRSPETEAVKHAFETARATAETRLATAREVLKRQSGINRVLRLGRVPLVTARIMRALEDAEILGRGIKVLGTNALFAYEAAAGVHADSSLTSTEDIDLLLDARHAVRFVTDSTVPEASILKALRKADASFERSIQTFRARNQDGFLVDLIKPLRNPVWRPDTDRIGRDESDLTAAEIEGLIWQENAPPFEAIVIDERGEPVRMVTADPRVWMAHKLWLSAREDRNPAKRPRDLAQARAMASLLNSHFPHLPFGAADLRCLPRHVHDQGAKLYEAMKETTALGPQG